MLRSGPMNPEQEVEKVQTVVFVRHGIASHNVIDRRTGKPPNLKDPDMFDPCLTMEGKKQALDAGQRMRLWWKTTQLGEKIELVLISSLTRCLQTASLAFCSGDAYAEGNPEPTMACVDTLREAYGIYYPDRRRRKSLLETSWPGVHFDPAMTENDVDWSLTRRETYQDVMHRVNQFLQWLAQRPESNIVCVSHGVWIECMLHAYFPDALRHGDRVRNADCFASECVSLNGQFRRMQNVRRIDRT